MLRVFRILLKLVLPSPLSGVGEGRVAGGGEVLVDLYIFLYYEVRSKCEGGIGEVKEGRGFPTISKPFMFPVSSSDSILR